MVGLGISLLAALGFQSPFLTLAVDARDAAAGLIHVRETMPARPGKMMLSFPTWLPGTHSPSGRLDDVVNLYFRAGAQTLTWRRDDVEMFHIAVDVPAGVSSIEVEFDSAAQKDSTFSPFLSRFDWDRFLFYPTGARSDDVRVAASITLPPGWRMATPLIRQPSSIDRVDFPTVSLTEFIDSPAIAGRYFNSAALGADEEIDLASDKPEAVQLSSDALDKLKNLVAEANALFGAKHYRHYDFLATASEGAWAGLEHHECSEDGVAVDGWGPEKLEDFGELVCHEYVHSWNGKYRRPAGLATPDYDAPMKGQLLWVYEGMTQFWGKILVARTGFATPEYFREGLAALAANLMYRSGRNWRSLEDTAIASQILRGKPIAWSSDRRSQDYYGEAVFLWLEVDSIIRQQTKGQKSLDDFCKLFHGAPSGPPQVRPYTQDDIVQTLNQVAPYDWAGLLHTRVQTIQPQLSLAGLENDGWRLVFNETPNTSAPPGAPANDGYLTLGVRVSSDGMVDDVITTLPGGMAGLRPGMKIVGVDGKTYSDANLIAALKAKEEFNIEIDYGGELRTMHIVYKEGLKFPHLERDETKPDALSEVMKPLIAKPSPPPPPAPARPSA